MNGKEWLRYHDLNGLYCECVKDLPEEFRTPEVYTYAVQENGYAIEFVPSEFITAELCMEAVKNRGTAIIYVPEEFKTAEICRKAIDNSSCWGSVLEYIPEKYKSTAQKGKESKMDRTEERRLLKSKDDPEALQKLVDANMRFVEKVATLFKDKAPMQTLIDAGTIGLVKAIQNFNSEKHRIGFPSYAVWNIRATILEVIND